MKQAAAERPADWTVRVWGHLDGVFAPMGTLSYVFRGKDSFCLFHYAEEWLLRPGAFPADPVRLPLELGVFRTQEDEEVFSGIRDACPDGWGSSLLDLAAEQTGFALRETDYMLFPGPERIGALAFGPMEAPAPFAGIPAWAGAGALPAPSLEELAEAARLSMDGKPLPFRLRSCLPALDAPGGARPKAAIRRNGVPCLAKFESGEFPWSSVHAEHACMRLAAECGIRSAETWMERLPGGADVLLVRRFDREIRTETDGWKPMEPADAGNPFLKLQGLRGMPDAFGTYRQWPSGQTAGRAQTLSGRIRELRIPFASEMTFCGIPEHRADGSWQNMARRADRRDRVELFRRMCFDALCGNGDGHLRNTGFLLQNGIWRLSPAYDIAPCPVPGGLRAAQSMGLLGDAMTEENLLSDTAPFGLSREEAAAVYADMAARVRSRWEAVFLECGGRHADLPALAERFRLAVQAGETPAVCGRKPSL